MPTIFYFLIYVRKNDENKEEMAQTLGHEVFVHAERIADKIEALLHRTKKNKLKYDEIATLINKIGNEDLGGHKDHKLLKAGKKETYEAYIHQLKEVPGINKDKLDKKVRDDKEKY